MIDSPEFVPTNGPLGERRQAATQDAPVNARALLGIGASEYHAGRPNQALEPLLKACKALAGLVDRGALLEGLLLTGRAERDLGLIEDAARHFSEALDLARQEGSHGHEVDALNLQAGLLSGQGDNLRALEHLEQALETAREAELLDSQANILNNIGNLCRQLGAFDRALESLQSANGLITRLDSRSRTAAVSLINLGHLYRDMGDTDGAKAFYARARELGRDIDDQMVEVVSLNSLANVFGRSDEWAAARELYHQALEQARSFGFRQYEIDNLDGLGQSHCALAEHERAIRAHQEALSLARKISDHTGKVDALLGLGRNFLMANRPREALVHLSEALANAQLLEGQSRLITAHELLALAHERQDDPVRSLHHQRELRKVEKFVLNQKCEQLSKHLTAQFESAHARRVANEHWLDPQRKGHERREPRALAHSSELEQAQKEILSRLAAATEYRDDETGEHTRRVGVHAAAIARSMGWSEDDVQLLSWAARLHDVGKIGVRDAVLLKPGQLSDEELSLAQAHTVIGANILSGGRTRLLRMAEEIARSHHERWDGRGYPERLAGEQIPLPARIVAVADTFDALVHERPYKRAWSTKEALTEILLQSGHQFDPQVVAAFLNVCKSDGRWTPWALAPDQGKQEQVSRAS
jgi:HD-GYP domain-containing protein (c-di-GMP phosphodiesterase class II)/Tfp pilus assembly protein PilF